VLLDAWAGRPLLGGDRLYPPNPGLVDRVWQATFTVEGARRAGAAGDVLMLSRTQPKPARAPHLSLPEIQHPMIDAYLGPCRRAARHASWPRARCSSRMTATRRCGWLKSAWRGSGSKYLSLSDCARRAGAAGDGLMLSRTQPKPARAPHLSLPEIQNPMIDAYLGALGSRCRHFSHSSATNGVT
jgi:hypothetical protein